MKRLFVILVVAVFTAYGAIAQNGVSINTTGAVADPSAMLDVSSNNKGFLTPRMSEAERLAISSPARGLLVYQTDNDSGFWFYDGANWVKANAGDNLGNHTATSDLDMSNNKIVNVATCTNNFDAANKEYVDNAVAAGGGSGSSKPNMISNESTSTYTLSGAVQYCENLTEGGYNDWRLPTTEELLFYTGIPSASTNFLWTKTTTKPEMYNNNQNFETVRLSDGKWRNGIEIIKPFVGKAVNSSTSKTSYVSFGTITPSTPGNVLNVTHVQLMGYSSKAAYFQIIYNYADGTSITSEYVTTSATATILFDWSNINKPITLNSIELQGKSSVDGYTTYGTLSISGYESNPDQQDGNTLYVRCIR